MINMLIDKKDARVYSETISEILTKMTQYAQYHFQTEEQYMIEYDFPDYLLHKEQHMTFRKRTVVFCNETMSKKATVPVEILEYLKDWLTNHILITDMKYKEFFYEKGLR